MRHMSCHTGDKPELDIQGWSMSAMELTLTERVKAVTTAFSILSYSFVFELLYSQIIYKNDFYFQTVQQHKA